eukprot:scaffold20874_cov22-Tisochrysis_lutea.AAC.4
MAYKHCSTGSINVHPVPLDKDSWNAAVQSADFHLAIIHAANKPRMIREELQGIELPANCLYPRDLPNCVVDLVPELAYDPEKSSITLDAAG